VSSNAKLKDSITSASDYISIDNTAIRDNVIPLPTIQENDSDSKVFYETGKRIFDFTVASIALVLGFPMLLIVAVAIRLESEGPAIFKQTRVGKDGKEFEIYKFRSMKINSDNLLESLSKEELEEYKKEYKLPNDPRITKIGKFIRKTSIDEIPQLISIIKGDMSIVGPRPILEDELQNYGVKKDLFLSVKPGLTGYWQVKGRNNITYESGKRQAMELYYVETRSLWLDIKIIFWTVLAVIGMNGAS